MKHSKLISMILISILLGPSLKGIPDIFSLYEYDDPRGNNSILNEEMPIRLQSDLISLDGLTYNPSVERVIIAGKGDIKAISNQVRISHYLSTQDGYIAFAVITKDKLPMLRSEGLTITGDVQLDFNEVRDASRLGEILGSEMASRDAGLTGKGIKIAVVDTGTDFSNKDMIHAVARDVNKKPIMLDADGQGIVLTRTKFFANITPQGNLLNSTLPKNKQDDFMSTVYFNDNGVFLNLDRGKNGTKFEVYNSVYPLLQPLVLNATATKDWKIGTSKTSFIRSMSGEYHMGFILQIQFQLGRAGLIIVPVLVVDSKEKGVYDTIIPDMSSSWADFSKFELGKGGSNVEFDYDFTDEKQIKLGDGEEFLVYDDKKDGDVDLSVGTVGAHVLDIWGAIKNGEKAELDNTLGAINGTLLKPMDVNGTYFGMMFDFMGHGTGSAASIASRGHDTYDVYGNSTEYRLKGVAPDAKIIPVKALWAGDVVYGWYWAAGFDNDGKGNWNYTGRHRADIVNNSWGISSFPALDYSPGFDVLSLLASVLSIPASVDPAFPGVLMVISAGNTGFGYGTVGPPSSAPFALSVGATTNNVFVGSELTKKEPRYGNSTAYYDDVAEFSSRGPGPVGDVKPEVMSVGAFGFVPMPPNTKHIPNATGAFGMFGGTSMAAPLVSAAASLVMQGLADANMDSNPFLVKSILMSTATDLGSDPFTQGAGKAYLEEAVDYIKGRNGRFIVYTNDTYPTVANVLKGAIANYKIKGLGNYSLAIPNKQLQDGKWYGGYINRGGSAEAKFTIANPSNMTISVRMEPTMLQLINKQSINGTTQVRQKDHILNDTKAGYIPNYINLKDLLQIPEDTELMILKVYFPFEEFLNSTEPLYANSLRISSLYLYDWNDGNRDGMVWFNETSLVNRGGTWGTVQQVTVRDPLGRIKDTPLLGIYPVPTVYSYWLGNTRQNTTSMNYTLVASFYKKGTWDAVSLDTNAVDVDPRGQRTFNAVITVPEDTLPGIYQGYITAKSGSQVSNIPVSYVVPVTVSSKDIPLVIAGRSSENHLYDNAVISGSFDMLSRYNAGDWRFYHFNVTDPTINTLSMKISWRNNWTSVNAMVTNPDGRIIASSVPAGVFKVFLGWASNDWLGTTRASEGGGFYPAQNFGENSTVLYVPVNSTGIYSLMLHTTLFHGKSLTEPLVIETKPSTILPDTRAPVINVEFPQYASGVVAVPVDLQDDNIEQASYSVDGLAPVSLRDNATLVVDTTALSEGFHQISIVATDTVGHRSFKDVAFVADNTEPQLKVFSPEDNIVVSDGFDVNLEAFDPSLKVFSVLLPNGTSVENQSTFTVDTTSLADGPYDVVARAEDGAGHVVEEEKMITVDRTKPVVDISAPGNGQTVSGTIDIKYTVEDANLKSVRFNLGEKAVEIKNNGTYSLDTKTLFDGQYALEFIAEDMAGNVNSKAITVSVVNFGPILMNAQMLGIAIGAAIGGAIGAGVSITVLVSRHRRKQAQS